MNELTFKSKVIAGFAFSVLLVFIVGAYSYYSINKYETAFSRVEHTHQVIQTVDIAMISVYNAEIRIRGYIVSANPAFSSRYESAYQNALQKTKALQQLVSDNPMQGKRMDTLRLLIDKQFEMSQEVFATKKPLNTISRSLWERKTNLDKIRQLYPIIIANEEQLLVKRKALSMESSKRARMALFAGSIVSLIVLALLLYYIMFSFNKQRKSEAQIKLLNDRFTLISRATRDALFEWNLQTNEVWWSESHFLMFGFDPEGEMPTKEEWLAKLHPSGRKLIEAPILALADTQVNEWQEEIAYFKPDHTIGTLLYRGFVVRDSRKRAERILGSFIDITDRKNRELQKALLSEISMLFGQVTSLNEILHEVLARVVAYTDYSVAEVWLVGSDTSKITMTSRYTAQEALKGFLAKTGYKTSFRKGEGLVGLAWESRSTQYWNISGHVGYFEREGAAREAGLKQFIAMPLQYSAEVVGVLTLGLNTEGDPNSAGKNLQHDLTSFLGAEIRRKQLEQELSQIFHYAPDIICIVDAGGNYKKVNSAMCDILGYTEEELLTKSSRNLVHPEDINKTIANLLIGVEGDPILKYENRYISKTGEVKWLSWTSRRATEAGLFFSVAKDISDKKELEKLFTKATTLARIGSWEVDLVRGSIYWSDITREIHEVGPDYVPNLEEGINFYKGQGTRDFVARKVNDAIIAGIPFDIELQIVTAKGNVKWVRSIGDPEFSGNTCVKIAGSFQDITIRKSAEIAAQTALEERNQILESIDDAFFAVSKNWTVTYWNNMAERLMMKNREDIVGKDFWTEFPSMIGSESYKRYQQAMEVNQAVRFEDCNHGRWYEVSAYPSESGLAVYFKDITGRKNYENSLASLNENLKKQAKELSISNAELEQFAYVASHDLQEPLRMVTSFLAQLEKRYADAIDERGKRYIYFAVDGAKRMRQIILDLLEFSRVGRLSEPSEEIDVNQVIAEVTALYRNEIEEKKAQIIAKSLPTVTFFRTPLRQVLQNLVGNSLKYQKKDNKPVIEIFCEEKQTFWEFSVKDNGIGIEPEYFEKIFIIFQRLHNKDEYSGTGMGLAITKKIIENFGGRIWVESEDGKGSTFHFTILKHL